ncbi:MAG: hypothetical protein KatS3mg040_0961 [Candidatus Kapaibacterium sp.]|nr:MAG: hypothetical protein KatS3mg040_0961 [Candidatus Kapabacteria bacterium]
MRSHTRTSLLLALLVGVTVLPFLGNAYLFDWDEVNFAECAREMLVSGDYYHPQVDFEPFWEKPPLFFWVQAAAMHLFGVNEFAARFPNAIVGIATVLLLAYTGRRWVDETFGALWALLWVGSLLPNFYMHSGLIDPLFNFLMVASTVAALESITSKRRWLLLCASGILLGLAVLTKGPVAILLVGTPLLLVWWRQYGWSRTMADAAIVGALSVVPFGLWLLSDRSSYGQWFMRSFIEYQLRLLTTGDAGHSGPLYYHVFVLLLGCFPASWLAFAAFRTSRRIEQLNAQSLLFATMLAVVVVVFSIVKTKIVHYSSLAYYPITFFAAQALHRWWYHPEQRRWIGAIALGTIMVGTAMIATPLVLSSQQLLLSLVHDPFARSIVETARPRWTGLEWMAGALALGAAIIAIALMRRMPRPAVVTLLVGIALSVSAFLRVVAPRIQDFTQRELVEFCRRYSDRDVILHPTGFKTYVHLFYGKRRPEQSPRHYGVERSQWESFLLNSSVDRDVVFIAKRAKALDLLRRRDFVQLDDPHSAWLFLLRPRSTARGSTF